MFEVLKKLQLNSLWSGFYNGLRVPWCDYLFGNASSPPLEVLVGWDGAIDEPFHLVFEDVMNALPDAKFVYTVSEPEAWYDSYIEWFKARPFSEEELELSRQKMQRLDEPIVTRTPNISQPSIALDPDGVTYFCSASRYWGCAFHDPVRRLDPKVRETCLKGFRSHHDKVRSRIPPERLLVFNLTEGWSPLCNFLGKPVPDEPFPYIDRFAKSDQDEEAPIAFVQQAALVERNDH